MKFARILPLALAAAGLLGCASTSEHPAAPAPEPAAAAQEPPEKEDAEKKDAEKKDSAKDAGEKPDKAEELRKKSHELDYARLSLQLARFDAQAGEGEAQKELESAERALAAATVELENFRTTVRELENADRALDLDRAKQNVVEAEQELAELEAMYAQEKFAATTKELVLLRGRSRLEMSKRGLELENRRAAQQRTFEHPKRERELTEAVAKAALARESAARKVERTKLQQKLDLLKAEHSVEDVQAALAKLEKEAKAAP
jgi:HlyD family secretion protein